MRPLFALLRLLCLVALSGTSASAQAHANGDQTWLVVSDIHVNPYDRSPVPSPYGEDSNWALWTSTLRAMRAAAPNPQVVIVPGDVLAHHFPALATSAGGTTPEAAAENTMRRISRGLEQTFPQSQFLFVPGNNDDPCGDYRTAPHTAYMSALARIWKPLVDRDDAAPKFDKMFAAGGYYTAALPQPKMRAIALNDVYWSVLYSACGKVKGNTAAAELNWLRTTLAETPAGSRNLIVMHIPPGIDAMSTIFAHRLMVIPYLHGDDERVFLGLLERYRTRIAFAVAGHVHRSDFRVFGGVPIVIAPSVSPIYKNDPAFMRLQIAPDGTPHDYEIFAYDPQRRAWAEGLDFDQTYGARDFTGASVLQAHAKIARDASVQHRWIDSLVAGSPNNPVDASNWRTEWCAQDHSGRGFAACAGLRRRLLVLPIAAGLLVVIVVASIALIVTRLSSPRRCT
jgi:hypothetical protein